MPTTNNTIGWVFNPTWVTREETPIATWISSNTSSNNNNTSYINYTDLYVSMARSYEESRQRYEAEERMRRYEEERQNMWKEMLWRGWPGLDPIDMFSMTIGKKVKSIEI